MKKKAAANNVYMVMSGKSPPRHIHGPLGSIKKMKRHAYIIKGYSKTDDEAKATNVYVNFYLNFLNSIAGGAWEINELSRFEDPTSKQLIEVIESDKPEYALIVMIGHGATQQDHQLFQINENEIIRAGQLILNVPKQMVILESCRSNIENIQTVDLGDKIPKFERGGIVRAPIGRDKSRELFSQQLNNCKDGLVVCFACSVGEEAMNYYFSYGILTASMGWHLDPGPHFQTLNINELMGYLIKEIPVLSNNQVKKIQTPEKMGEVNFPFCVSKF